MRPKANASVPRLLRARRLAGRVGARGSCLLLVRLALGRALSVCLLRIV